MLLPLWILWDQAGHGAIASRRVRQLAMYGTGIQAVLSAECHSAVSPVEMRETRCSRTRNAQS